jgi:enoyl-CoA hydratase/carnithine racemase
MNPANGTAETKDLISIEIKANIGTVTIDDPHKANCLSSAVLHGLLRAFDEFEPQNSAW